MQEATKKFALEFVKKTIENFVRCGEVEKLPENYPPELAERKGVFVTIYSKKEEKLRGCVGFPHPTHLLKALRDAAIAATHDPRFPPLSPQELEDIVVEISFLTPLQFVGEGNLSKFLDQIKPFEDGLLIERFGASGLFLPQVWREIPEKEEFLSNLCLKAGLPPDSWLLEGTKLYKFQVETVKG